MFAAPSRGAIIVSAMLMLTNQITKLNLTGEVVHAQATRKLPLPLILWYLRLLFGIVMLITVIIDVTLLWFRKRFHPLRYWYIHLYLRISVVYMETLTNIIHEIEVVQCAHAKNTPLVKCFDRVVLQSIAALFSILVLPITVRYALLPVALIAVTQVILYSLPASMEFVGQPTEIRFSRPALIGGYCCCFYASYWWRETEDRTRFLATEKLTALCLDCQHRKDGIAATLSSVCDPTEMKILLGGESTTVSSPNCTLIYVIISDFIRWRQSETPEKAIEILDSFHTAVDTVSQRLDFRRVMRCIDRFALGSGFGWKPTIEGDRKHVQDICQLMNRFARRLKIRLQYGIAFGKCEMHLLCGMTMYRIVRGKSYALAKERAEGFKETSLLFGSTLSEPSPLSVASVLDASGFLSETAVVEKEPGNSNDERDPNDNPDLAEVLLAQSSEDLKLRGSSSGDENQLPETDLFCPPAPSFPSTVLASLSVPEEMQPYVEGVLKTRSPLIHATWLVFSLSTLTALVLLVDGTGPGRSGTFVGDKFTPATGLLWLWVGSLCTSVLTLGSQWTLNPMLNVPLRWIFLFSSLVQLILQTTFFLYASKLGYPLFDVTLLHFPLVIFVVTSLDGVPLPIAMTLIVAIQGNFFYWFGILPQTNLSILEWLLYLILLVLFYPTLVIYRFTSMRKAFIDLMLNKALTEEAEKERQAHQQALRLFIPHCILPSLMQKLDSRVRIVVAESLPDVVLLTLLVPLMERVEDQISFVNRIDQSLQRFRGYQAWSKLEDEGQHSEQLLTMECNDGDTIRIGGPLHAPREELSQLPLRSMGVKDDWIEHNKPEELLANSAAIILVQLLSDCVSVYPEVTALLHRDDGVAAVIGASRPTFSIEGVVRERSDAILQAQECGKRQLIASEDFLRAFPFPTDHPFRTRLDGTNVASGFTNPREIHHGTGLLACLSSPLKHRLAHLGYITVYPMQFEMGDE